MLINVNPDDIISQTILGYVTSRTSKVSDVEVQAVVLVRYKHPEAPDHAVIDQIELKKIFRENDYKPWIGSINTSSSDPSYEMLNLHIAAQTVIDDFVKKNNLSP